MWSNNPNRRQVLFLWWTDQVILNKFTDHQGRNGQEEPPQMVAKDVVSNMRQAILRLKGEYMNESGTEVDYLGMSTSEAFSDFKKLTQHLQTLDIGSLSPQERKALMINIYNCLAIHGLVSGVLGDPTSTTSRLKFYASVSYIIQGLAFSLNDIEHGILRGNKASPVPLSSKPFAINELEKLNLCLELDPRIHFALNCGAKGCPPIGVYSADSIDKQLDRATRAYLNETVVDTNKNTVSISMLFKWYRSDFGSSDESVLSWIEDHASVKISSEIKKLREVQSSIPIEYLEYDWNLPSKTQM